MEKILLMTTQCIFSWQILRKVIEWFSFLYSYSCKQDNNSLNVYSIIHDWLN